MNRAWPTIRRLIVILVSGLLGISLLAVGAISLVLNTAAGTHWALTRVLDVVNGLPGQQLSFAGTSGTLVAGLQVDDLVYESAAVRVSVGQAELSWNPFALMSMQVSVSGITLDNSRVEILPSTSPDQPEENTGPLISFPPLPVSIELDQLSVRQLTLVQSQQTVVIDSISLSASLQGESLDINSLALTSELADIEGDLALLLTDNLPLDADLRWQYHDDLYPESGPAAGLLVLTGDLHTLQIRHRLQQPLSLTSEGSLETGLAGGTAGIDLLHRADSLTVPQVPVDGLVLNGLQLSTAGPFQSLAFDLTTTVESGITPAIAVSVQAGLQGTLLTFETLQLATDTGQLNGTGELNLGSPLSGRLNYQLAETTPLAYLESQLPIDISDVTSNGGLQFSLADDALQGSLQLAELAGQFGDYPFQVGGRVDYRDGALLFENIRLATEDNQMLVTGTLADDLDFNWQLSAPQLNQFIEALGGQLQANGRLYGSFADVQLSAAINGQAIRYNDLFVDSLQVNLARQDQTINGTIEAREAGLQRDGQVQRIDSLTVQVAGTDSQHRGSLAVVSDYGNYELALQGGFSDLATLDWSGALTSGTLDSPAGIWQLAANSALSFDRTAFQLEDNCWRQGAATVCLTGSGNTQADGLALQANGQIRDYPLTVLNHPVYLPEGSPLTLDALPRLPEMVRLQGTTDADLTFTMAAASGPAVNASLQPRNLSLTIRSTEPQEQLDPDDPVSYSEQVYNLTEPLLTARLENGIWNFQAGTRVEAQVASDQGEALSGTLNSRLQLSPGGQLNGELVADLGDIGWLGAFTQDVENIAGTLTGDVRVGGTLEEPRLDLDLELANGQFTVIPLGIAVSDLSSSLTSLEDGSIQLVTNARSGEGNLQLQGLLSDPYSPGRSLQAQLSGENFTLAAIPDLNLSVTPNVTVAANNQRIDLGGSLHLPTLVINLIQLPETAVDISRDAVVIDYPQDRPELARSIASDQSTLFNIPVVADVDISLGEQVSFNGFGLTTDVAGNLNVRQQENGTNLTYGELEIVSGQYTLYGRSLEIRQGKLLFFGAYDNPALDIRATRQVENVTVGVLMNGTLKNIHSQLFSTPALSDGDIIAIMITGKPFSEMGQQESNAVVGAIANLGLSRSQGLTNQVREQLGLDTLGISNTGNINSSILTIGKYLTPDLFIRYGIGLFDHQSKLSLDYTLTERITLQAETGEYQSVDVIYKVER